MKRGVLYKCLVGILCLAMLIPGTVFGEFNEYEPFGDIGYKDEQLSSIAKGAVVLRADNNLYYYDNVGASFSTNAEIYPYLDTDGLCAPVESILKSFGYTTKVSGENLRAIKDGRQVEFSTNEKAFKAHMCHGLLYAAVSEIAAALGMEYYDNGTVGVIGKNADIPKITDESAEKLSAGLAYKWDNVHLGALGYITTLVTHPKDSELLYAVTDVGGLYKLDRANNKFVQLLTSAPYQISGVKAVRGAAIDPNDEGVIYITAGRWSINNKGGIFKSTDKGSVWRKLNFPNDVNVGQGNAVSSRMAASNIFVDPVNGNIVYANTVGSGLWRSEDAGETWAKVSGIPDSFNGLDGTFVYIDGHEKAGDRARYVFAGFSGGGLVMSSDGGKTFKTVPGAPTRPFDMVYSDGGYYVTGNGYEKDGELVGFFRFENGEWQDRTPISNGQRHIAGFIAIDPKDKNHILLGGAPFQASRIFSTNDAGKTWSEYGSFGDVSELTFDPIEEDGLWLPFGAGIKYIDNYKSENKSIRMRDYGIEMLVVQKGMSEPDPKSPLFHATFMDHGFRAVESIYTRSPDTLPFMNTGCGSDFCEEDNRIVVKVGLKGQPPRTGGLVDISYDYGRTFTRTPWDSKMGNMGIVDVAVGATTQENGKPIIMVTCTGFADKNGEGRGVYRSLDGGESWEICEGVSVRRQNADWYQIRSIASDRVNGSVFYYMDAYEIYRTMDAGKTWEVVRNFEDSHSWYCIKTIPGIEGGVWYFGTHGETFASYDFGQTWEKVEGLIRAGKAAGFGIGKPGSKYPAVYMSGCEEGSDVYGVYMSDDLGKTWRKISKDGNQLVVGNLDITGDRKVYGRCFVAAGGSALIAGWPVTLDDSAPVITLDNENSKDELSPEYAVNDKSYSISGSVNEFAEVRINGETVPTDGYDKFRYTAELKEGENTFLIEAKDRAGNYAEPVKHTVRYVPGYLKIGLDSGNKIITSKAETEISGYLIEQATVYIDGAAVRTDANNRFSYIKKTDGNSSAEIYAVDNEGNKSIVESIEIVYDKTPPIITADNAEQSTERYYKIFSGTLDEPGEVMINGAVLQTDENNRFSYKLPMEIGSNPIRIIARDAAKNVSKPMDFYVERLNVDKAHITAARLSDSFVYDGDISDWDLKYHCDKLINGTSDNDISFGLAYDDTYLYVGVRVEDASVNTGSTPNYNNDSVEFYIDGGNEKAEKYDQNDKQICCVPDESYRTDDNYRFKITDYGYTMEFRFVLADYGVKAVPGTVIGFELACNDNDRLTETGSRDGVFAFNANADSWKNTKDFSNCTFVE